MSSRLQNIKQFTKTDAKLGKYKATKRAHTISVEAIAAGFKGESQASTADQYSTANEAVIAMCKDLNVNNYQEYFSDRLQKELFS